MDVVGNRCLGDLIEERVAKDGDKTFLIFESDAGDVTRFSYREFDGKINRLANALREMGVQHGDKVTVMMANRPEFLQAWFAINKLGAVLVPANVFYAAPELEYVLEFSDSVAFITEPAFLEVFEAIRENCPRIRHVIVAGGGPAPQGDHFLADIESTFPATRPAAKVSPDDISQILFTSGTTSRPKGVMLSHRSGLFQGIAVAMALNLTDADRMCVVLPLFHVNGQYISAIPILTAGGTLVILERFSATKFWDQVRRHDTTLMSIVPMQLRTMLAQPPRDDDARHNVRLSFYALPTAKEEWEAFIQRFQVPLIDGYGLSETLGVCTINPVQYGVTKRHCIGLPSIGRQVRIVDDSGTDLGEGEVGRILVKGEAIFSGYYKNEEATNACMHDGWFDTGDNGYFDEDGYIHFFDRTKEVIKRAGENIAASEVERVLNDHPKILESAVIGLPDELRDEAVKAFVVLHPGQQMTAEEVQGWVARHLAKFKIPSFVEFRDELPHTSIGKVIKYQLKNEELEKLRSADRVSS